MDHAQEVQAGNDDDQTGDLAEQRQIGGEHLAGRACRGAENDEHRGEAEHEGDRRQHNGGVDVARRLVLAGQLVEGGAAEETEVGRNERQHARAERKLKSPAISAPT